MPCTKIAGKVGNIIDCYEVVILDDCRVRIQIVLGEEDEFIDIDGNAIPALVELLQEAHQMIIDHNKPKK